MTFLSTITSTIDRYEEHCCFYAAAAHHVTGYPAYFLGCTHVILKSPQGWFDEIGIRPIEEIAADWNEGGKIPFVLGDVVECTEFDYKWLRTYHGIEGWDEIVAKARKQAVLLNFPVRDETVPVPVLGGIDRGSEC